LGYVTQKDRFSVFDLTDMKNTPEIASIPLENISGDAFYDGVYAYQPIDGNRQLSVVDISKPTQPIEIGRIDVPFVPQGARQGIGYSIESNREIRFTTLSMKHPNELYRIEETVFPHDVVKYQDGWLIKATINSLSSESSDSTTTSSISIHAFEETGEMAELSRFTIQGSCKTIFLESPLLVITTEQDVQIFDCSDLTDITLQSSFSWNDENRVVDFVQTDSYFFLCNRHFYFRIRELKEPWGQYWIGYSLVDPHKPRNLGRIDCPWEIRNRIQKNSLIYYVDEGDRNLRTLDFSDPEHPTDRGIFHTFAFDYYPRFSFWIDGNRLYVSRFSWEKKNRIYLFDITQPMQPVFIADFNLPFSHSSWSTVSAICVNREKLAVLGSSDDPNFQFYYPYQPFYLYDISDLSNPVEIDYAMTNVGTSGPLFHSQNNLFLFPPSFGYYVIPLSNPSSKIKGWQFMR